MVFFIKKNNKKKKKKNNYNKKGKDEVVLKKYEEPPWNNPVVRFLNSEGKDLIQRKDGVYTQREMMERMNLSLTKF